MLLEAIVKTPSPEALLKAVCGQIGRPDFIFRSDTPSWGADNPMGVNKGGKSKTAAGKKCPAGIPA